MAAAERLLWYLNFAATLGLLIRLSSLKLIRVYPSVFWYWFAQVLEAVALFLVPLKSPLYTDIYYLVQSLNLLLAIFVMLELFRASLTRHPALARFGRQSALIILSLGAVLAAFGVFMDSTLPPGRALLLQRFLVTERTVDLTVLAFLLLMSLFLLWFPVRVKRNVAVYITGFVLFYSTHALGLFLINSLPQPYILPMSTALLASSLACVIGWTLFLRPEAKDVVTVTGSAASVAALDRLSARLEEMNRAVGRLSRDVLVRTKTFKRL